jgi:hypothetical protein
MKPKTIFIFLMSLLFTSCGLETDKISGHAIIVDNFKDKNPIEGLYIEIEHTVDEGYNYEVVEKTKTDKNGFFEIDTKFRTGFMCIDCWAVANVYSDNQYSDTLGSFGFQFANNTYRYKTIHLDTFSLPHNIWLIPKIINLDVYQPDAISIDFYNIDLVDSSQKLMTYYGSVAENQTFTPVEISMDMNLQHWLSYGSKDLARGSLKKDSKEIGFGYFKLENSKRTVEGDTLYLNFTVEKYK